MADDNPDSSQRSFVERIAKALGSEPRNRAALLETLENAHQRSLIDADSLSMINGVFEIADMQVRDIMIPSAQMVCVEIDAPLEEIFEVIINSGHSRFPVIGESRDEVLGVILAKDLLRLAIKSDSDVSKDNFKIKDYMRKTVLSPESKRLNVLLRDLRNQRTHMAIVIDEYGGVAGVITIEDVLERIVGDIDDEHDSEEEVNIQVHEGGNYAVRALTPIDEFNAEFSVDFADDEFDTVGGLVTNAFGYVPRSGETVHLGGYLVTVLEGDERCVHKLKIEAAEPVDSS